MGSRQVVGEAAPPPSAPWVSPGPEGVATPEKGHKNQQKGNHLVEMCCPHILGGDGGGEEPLYGLLKE